MNNLNNVRTYNLALSDRTETITLTDDQKNFLSGTLFSPVSTNEYQKTKTYEVPGLRLEDFLETNNITKIDLLKTNIEGAESFVVSGLKRKMFEISNLAIACHDFRWRKEGNEFFKTKKLVTDFLESINYRIITQNTGFDYIDDWVYATKK